MFQKRKVSPMYFLGLLFLVFPLYYTAHLAIYPFIVFATVLFGGVYISLLYTQNHTYEKVAWIYLLAYIAYMSFAGNIQFSLFLFNLSNLLTWHYSEDKWTYRTVSYGILLTSLLIWSTVGPYSLDITLFMFILHAFALAMFFGGRMQLSKEKAEQKLQEQNASINLLIAENERNRIGQDLHDTLGHVFATMTLKTELALKQLDKGNLEAVKKELFDLNATSRKSMVDVRTIVNQLKYRSLDEELESLRQVFELAEIELVIKKDYDSQNLSPVLQSSLTMMVRELANNVIKHASAHQAILSLADEGDQLIVEMADDGQGFSSQSEDELQSLKNRLALIKGEVEVLSRHHPTCVRLSLPFRKE